MREISHILRNAKGFRNGYDVLSKHNEKARNIAFKAHDRGRLVDLEDMGSAESADLVCLSLSLELYLKALLRKYPPSKKLRSKELHNWHSLFRALPEVVQEELHQRWVLHYPSITPRKGFDMWLLKEGDNFTRWRYSHEMYDKKMSTMSFHPDKAERLIDVIKEHLGLS